jgi:hypothetical protein
MRQATIELIIKRSNQQCSTEQTQTHIHTLAAVKLTAVLYSGCSNCYFLAQKKSKNSFSNAFIAENIICDKQGPNNASSAQMAPNGKYLEVN